MRHYTQTFLLLLVAITMLTGCLSANSKEYHLYTDCDEYYDSRGFYHKTCDKNSFNRKEALRTYTYALETIEPGKGEDNTTQETPNTNSTPLIDTIDDEEESASKESEDETSKKVRALSENVNLEFGKE